MVSHLVVLYRSPCSASRSPPSCHCPLLPITVLSFPSLSPPPHHCPLLPVTVPSSSSLFPSPPSFPPLSPPPHHCSLLPITVPFSPLLPTTVPSSTPLFPPPHHCPLLLITSCYHGRLFFPHYSQGIPSSPQSGGLPAVQVPGSVGTAWYGPGIGPTLMNNVAWTASHPPGDKLKWKAL
ncbi:hypothetical protein EMCRGX_G026757, partial [Ephydatia muelleri]